MWWYCSALFIQSIKDLAKSSQWQLVFDQWTHEHELDQQWETSRTRELSREWILHHWWAEFHALFVRKCRKVNAELDPTDENSARLSEFYINEGLPTWGWDTRCRNFDAVQIMLMYNQTTRKVMLLFANFLITEKVVKLMVTLGQQNLQRNVAYPLVLSVPVVSTHVINIEATLRRWAKNGMSPLTSFCHSSLAEAGRTIMSFPYY